MHKDTSNGHFVGGKSLLCLSRLARCFHTLFISNVTYHIKGISHKILMLLIIQNFILLLPFKLNIINSHNDQSLMSSTQVSYMMTQ